MYSKVYQQNYTAEIILAAEFHNTVKFYGGWQQFEINNVVNTHKITTEMKVVINIHTNSKT